MKRAAFIFALPIRTNPILITMPFGLNVIKLLDKEGYQIDVYLSEYKSDAYNGLFSSNTTVHFLDHNYMWPKEGWPSYIALTSYFKWKSHKELKNKYDYIFTSGMAGITLGGILKKKNKGAKLIYMNDEFPVQHETNIWVRSEIRNASNADLVVVPDEERFTPLAKQIPGLSKKKHFTLPNTPLMNEIDALPEVDWHEYFKIPKHKKLFLMAGGLQEFNLISELLDSVSKWPDDTVLILKGKHDVSGFRERYKAYDDPEKIIWTAESFSPDKLHSLIKYCNASLCLYRPINDNLKYVGKSSGKLMRSVLLGKPVIVNKAPGFEFVDDLGIGIQVDGNKGIQNGVQFVLDNGEHLEANCKKHYPNISFEKYWDEFKSELDLR